jgi:hypothetical protein
MKAKLVDLYKRARDLHEEFVRADADLRKMVMTCASVEEHADTSYALRETADFVEDVRKRCEAIKKLAEQIACVLYTQMGMKDTIRTDYCSATPDIRTIVTIPRKSSDPENFGKLMTFLGVPPELWNAPEESTVVKPHWPGLMAHLHRMQIEGKPLPPGVDPNKTYPEYKLIVRKRKGVSE